MLEFFKETWTNEEHYILHGLPLSLASITTVEENNSLSQCKINRTIPMDEGLMIQDGGLNEKAVHLYRGREKL